MQIMTKRLILRPWRESDAEVLYALAKDRRISDAAGWPSHKSVEHSLEVIRTVFSLPENYAVCEKEENVPIGAVGIMIGEISPKDLPNTQGEIGYWMGFDHWGKGYTTEAVSALMERGFETLGLEKLWCGYFDGNFASKRVQEKCGFQYHHTNQDEMWELLQEIRTEHISCLTKEEWIKKKITGYRHRL